MSNYSVDDEVYVKVTPRKGQPFWANCTIIKKNEDGTYKVSVYGTSEIKNVSVDDLAISPSSDTSDDLMIESLKKEQADLEAQLEQLKINGTGMGSSQYSYLIRRLEELNKYIGSRGGIGRKSRKSKKSRKSRKSRKSKK